MDKPPINTSLSVKATRQHKDKGFTSQKERVYNVVFITPTVNLRKTSNCQDLYLAIQARIFDQSQSH